MNYELKLERFYYDIMDEKIVLFIQEKYNSLFIEFFSELNKQIQELIESGIGNWESCKDKASFKFIKLEYPDWDDSKIELAWIENKQIFGRGILVSTIREIENLSSIIPLIRSYKIDEITE